MSKPMRTARRRQLASSQYDPTKAQTESKGSILKFPAGYHLIVTTAKGVFSWDMSGVVELFRSGSEGILASQNLAGSKGKLAVADSQVVVLHDVNKGLQRSYRLKGSEGQIRLLRYAPSTRNLYFTTTLQNSVQSFSVKDSKLLGSFNTHQAPPAVFAVSCDSRLLLSTSIGPPTIQLCDLTSSMPPMLLHPPSSTCAVVAADFHPEDPYVFILAFADGCTAIYDALRILETRDLTDEISAKDRAGEIASIRGIHGKADSDENSPPSGRVLAPGTWTASVAANTASITAVAFVPGRKATAVTLGADGKCCVIDFTQPSKDKAVLMKSWHLRRPATSLSIVYSGSRSTGHTQVDGLAPMIPSNLDYCIAIGRQDGKVLLFDLDGHPLGQRVLDPQRSKIVNVEWAPREIDLALSEACQNQKIDSVHNMSVLKEKNDRNTAALKGQLASRRRESLFDFVSPIKAINASHNGLRHTSSRSTKRAPLLFPHIRKLPDRLTPAMIPAKQVAETARTKLEHPHTHTNSTAIRRMAKTRKVRSLSAARHRSAEGRNKRSNGSMLHESSDVQGTSGTSSGKSVDTIISWTPAADLREQDHSDPTPTYIRCPPVVPLSPLKPRSKARNHAKAFSKHSAKFSQEEELLGHASRSSFSASSSSDAQSQLTTTEVAAPGNTTIPAAIRVGPMQVEADQSSPVQRSSAETPSSPRHSVPFSMTIDQESPPHTPKITCRLIEAEETPVRTAMRALAATSAEKSQPTVKLIDAAIITTSVEQNGPSRTLATPMLLPSTSMESENTCCCAAVLKASFDKQLNDIKVLIHASLRDQQQWFVQHIRAMPNFNQSCPAAEAVADATESATSRLLPTTTMLEDLTTSSRAQDTTASHEEHQSIEGKSESWVTEDICTKVMTTPKVLTNPSRKNE